MKFWIAGAVAAALLAFMVFPGTGSTTVAHANGDYCGVEGVFDVPDSGLTFDFADACAGHDECYRQGGTEADRRSCDDVFLADMLQSCTEDWPYQWWLNRRACSSVAYVYFLGVYVGGWAFFPYGNPT